ncbi:MAG: hypothetical protein WBA76_07600, partial [Phormidesmis sp.]
HYKFEGIAYVVSLSPVFAAFASVLRWRPLMTVGTHVYEWIATHRKVAGRFTRPFRFKPLTINNSGWLNAIALLMLALALLLGLRSAMVFHSTIAHQNFF